MQNHKFVDHLQVEIVFADALALSVFVHPISGSLGHLVDAECEPWVVWLHSYNFRGSLQLLAPPVRLHVGAFALLAATLKPVRVATVSTILAQR